MSKTDKISKTGFVIKLSDETVQKLSSEEESSKNDKSLSGTSNTSKVNEEETRATEETKDIISSPVNNSDHDTSDIGNIEKKTEETPDKTSEANSSWGEYAPYITYEGDEAIYTDPTSQQRYTWNQTSNSWVPKEVPGRIYTYENDTHTYTEADGSKFFWDLEKKAWLPKVDDDFLAFYQMSYGFVDNTSQNKEKEEPKKVNCPKKDPVPLKRKNEPQWFQPSDETNTKVYVSNLPQDMSEEEFVNLMQKCGLIERDPSSQKMKVKLYFDKDNNCFKGDALCTYIKIESVDLALKLLDGSDYKGNKIKVERAHFQLKGEYNPALKPKKRKKKELEKLKKMQQKLFDWRPEKLIGERAKHEKVVIVKNLFHPSDFDKDVQLILDYQQDLREECAKCGDVRKVVIYDRHPEGVAQISMKEPEQADAVIQLINGRWFGKRQIVAETWDGRTKYRIAETDSEISKRVNTWEKFLEGKEEETAHEIKQDTSNNPVDENVPSEEKNMEARESSITTAKT